MELVIDANVVVAGFLRSATTRELLLNDRLVLHAPEFSLIETEKVLSTPRLRKRLGGMSREDVRSLVSLLTANVRIVPATEYSDHLKKALEIAPHSEGAPYLALAIHLSLPLWSNDAGMKEQNIVSVYTTKELLALLRSS